MKTLLLCLMFVLFSTVYAAPQKIIHKKNGNLVLSKSYIAFPEKIGNFIRGRTTKYDKDGNDVSFSYNLWRKDLQVVATIYVYPAPNVLSFGSSKKVIQQASDKLFNFQYESVKAHILKAYEKAKLLSEGTRQKKLEEKTLKGKYAKFEYEHTFARRKQKLLSEFYLFQINKWFLKYRITYPEIQQKKAEPEIQKLLKNKMASAKPEKNET